MGATVVAKALGRSAGAVGNCLTRLAAAGQVFQISDKPRRYKQHQVDPTQGRSTLPVRETRSHEGDRGWDHPTSSALPSTPASSMCWSMSSVTCEPKATRDAVDTYATSVLGATRPRRRLSRSASGASTRSSLELEEQLPGSPPGATVIGATPLMRDVARDGAREALERLHDAHQHYESRVASRFRESLLGAAKTATAWVATLTAIDHVDLGPRA